MNKLIALLLFVLLCVPLASAACFITTNKQTYFSLATSTATMNCSSATEKSKAYNVTWWNGTAIVQTNTGTTPSVTGQNFFESYLIPNNVNWTTSYVNLSVAGSGVSQYYFNVSTSNINTLIIGTYSIGSELFLGKVVGLAFSVTDRLSSKVTNANCEARITQGTTSPAYIASNIKVIDGVGAFDFPILQDGFEEGTEYVANIRCQCPVNNSYQNYCYNSSSSPEGLYGNYGSSQYAFHIGNWLTINTVTDQSNYIQKEEIFICANVSNNYSTTESVYTQVHYNVRCSADADNYNETDRSIIIADEASDLRGIPANATRVQCKRFVVPEPRYLQGKTSQCFASSYVDVINDRGEVAVHYRSDSPYFNITIDDMQYNPDWQRISATQYNSVLNLSESSYNDYNGSGTGNVDIRLDRVGESINAFDQESRKDISFDRFLLMRMIKNWTVLNASGAAFSDVGLEMNDDGNIELEVRSADRSRNGYFNVTLYLYSFEETNGLDNLNSNITASLSNVTSALRDINSSQALIANYTGEVRTHLSSISTNIALIETTLNGVETYVGQLETTMNGIETATSLINYSLANISNNVSFIGGYLNNLQTYTGQIETTLNSLDSNTSRGADSLNLAQGYLNNIKTSIASIDTYTVLLANYTNRSATALEDIANKTGTFKWGIDCPSTAGTGQDITCTITGQVEDSQQVEKEVDFDCYIKDGTTQYSSINFNQMITRTVWTTTKTFGVPSNLNSDAEYSVVCEAHYYNLGSRTDTFSDSFRALTSARVGQAAGYIYPESAPPEAEPEVLDYVSKEYLKRNWTGVIFTLIIFGIVFSGVLFLIVYKKKRGVRNG